VIYGCNLHHGGQRLDRSSAVVILQTDGSAVVRVGLTDMGQGNLLSAQTVAAQALGLDPARVEVWQPDTTTVGDSGPTVASRGTHASGRAILDAVRRLRERLDPVAAELLSCRPQDVELVAGTARNARRPEVAVPLERVAAEMAARRIETVTTGWYRSPERPFDPETGLGEPYETYALACHVARVEVDPDLGTVRVRSVAAAHDVGTVIHRDGLEGQIEGGVAQGVGWALSEELCLDRGRLLNPNFTDYVIPTAADAPEVHIAILEGGAGAGPYGAKGIGEPSFIPTAAAVRNAVVAALGVELDQLPMTPPRVVAAQGAAHRYAWLLEELDR
jgi:CO/xanthine dehydrogenase Mo-binding subunit